MRSILPVPNLQTATTIVAGWHRVDAIPICEPTHTHVPALWRLCPCEPCRRNYLASRGPHERLPASGLPSWTIAANSTRFMNYVVITQSYRATTAAVSPCKDILYFLLARIIDGDKDPARQTGSQARRSQTSTSWYQRSRKRCRRLANLRRTGSTRSRTRWGSISRMTTQPGPTRS